MVSILIYSQPNKGGLTGLEQPALGNVIAAASSQPTSIYGNSRVLPLDAEDPLVEKPWDLHVDDMLGVVDEELLFGSSYLLKYDQERGTILDGDDQVLGGGETPP